MRKKKMGNAYNYETKYAKVRQVKAIRLEINLRIK